MGAKIPPTLTLLLGGTSLTAGRLCTPPLPWTYYLLRDMMGSPYCKGPVRIINTGKGSQTSNFGATQAALMAPLRPTHVLMEDFGINDCAIGPVSIPQATANFDSMVASYRAANPDVIICHQTMSPASAADVNRTDLPDYYDNGLVNAALNGLESLDNYYGTLIVPGGWPKPLPYSLTVGYEPLSPPSGFSVFPNLTTWNPSDKVADITLTEDNLVATRTGAPGAAWASVRATESVSSGKWFFQAVPTNAGQMIVGIATSALNLATQFVGGNATSWGYRNDGRLYNNSVFTALPTYASGDTISVALDLDNNALWFRVNSDDWNGSPTADPATNTGGTAIAAGTYLAGVSISSQNDLWTADFGNPGDGLHPVWPDAFQLYSYPNILDWTERMMAAYWPD